MEKRLRITSSEPRVALPSQDLASQSEPWLSRAIETIPPDVPELPERKTGDSINTLMAAAGFKLKH